MFWVATNSIDLVSEVVCSLWTSRLESCLSTQHKHTPTVPGLKTAETSCWLTPHNPHNNNFCGFFQRWRRRLRKVKADVLQIRGTTKMWIPGVWLWAYVPNHQFGVFDFFKNPLPFAFFILVYMLSFGNANSKAKQCGIPNHILPLFHMPSSMKFCLISWPQVFLPRTEVLKGRDCVLNFYSSCHSRPNCIPS